MTMKVLAIGAAILVCLGCDRKVLAETDAITHPMDGLTAPELAASVKALVAAGHADENSRYCMLTLNEPPKAEVLGWKPGDVLPREAFAVVKNGPLTFEAVVDVSAGAVKSWKPVKGVQPGVLIDEWTTAQQIVQADSGWQAALRKRG